MHFSFFVFSYKFCSVFSFWMRSRQAAGSGLGGVSFTMQAPAPSLWRRYKSPMKILAAQPRQYQRYPRSAAHFLAMFFHSSTKSAILRDLWGAMYATRKERLPPVGSFGVRRAPAFFSWRMRQTCCTQVNKCSGENLQISEGVEIFDLPSSLL